MTAPARRPAAALAAGLFAVAYGTNVSTPLLLLYQERLALGEPATMAIFSAYPLGILITLLVAGPLSDRFGRRPVVLPLVAGSALTSLLFVPGADRLGLLVGARFLLGAVSGGAFAVGSAWLQEIRGAGRELATARTVSAVLYVGFGLGPITTAAMERWLPAPLALPFLVHAGVTGAVLLGMLRLPETVVRARGARPFRIELGIPPAMRPVVLRVLAPTALFVFAFPSTSFALFPVLLRDAMPGFEVLVAGASGAVTAWSTLLSRPLVARHGPRRSAVGAVWIGAAGLATGTAAFASGAWPLLLPAAMALGTASGACMTSGLALVNEIALPHARGALSSTFYLLAYLGMTTPVVVASLAEGPGFPAVLAGLTALALAAALGLGRSTRRIGPRPGG